MKNLYSRIAALAALGLSAAFAVGCTQNSFNISVAEHDWQFTVARSSEDGSALFCAEEVKDRYDGAEVADIQCTVADGKLTITNLGLGSALTLDYALTSSSAESAIYALSGGAEGIASVGITRYNGDESEYTLIVTVEGMSVYFMDEA